MTDQHPLTDETCEDLSSCITIITAPGEPDPYICPQYIADDMRAAADWQLEQVINWIRCSPWVGSDCPIYDFEDEQDRLQLIADIKKSMRPITTQEESDD